MLVYNYAAILSGGFATMQLGIDDRAPLFALLFVFALFWTGYFRLQMVPRLVDEYGGDESGEPTDGET